MFEESFPKSIEDDVISLEKKINIQKMIANKKSIVTEQKCLFKIGDSTVKVPYRTYLCFLYEMNLTNLNKTEELILNCINTRNHNGYIRQEYIKKIISVDYEDWVIPFIIKCADEYIIEILFMMYEQLSNKANEKIKLFCEENKDVMHKSYDRMQSYWDVFYSERYPDFPNYIGRKLFKECFGIQSGYKEDKSHK